MDFTKFTKVFRSVSLVGAGTMFNAVLGFVFLTGVAKTLPVSEFGKYALLTGLLTLLSRITDFGTNSLYVANVNQSPKSDFLSAKLVLFLVSIPITIIFLTVLRFNNLALIAYFIAGLISYGVSYTLYAFYQSQQKYLEIVVLNGIPAVVKGLYGILLYLNIINLNLDQSFGVFAISILLGSVVVFFSKINISNIKLNLALGFRVIVQATSPGLSQLVNESWQTINYLITKFFNSYMDVGIFSMANKISNIFALVSYSIFTVLLPKNAERKKNSTRYDFTESFILACLVLILSIVAIFAAEMFLSKAFGDKFSGSMQYLDLLIFASAIMAIQNFLENYFYVHNATNYLVIINGTRMVSLITLALVGIPMYGLYFLATANIISAIVGLLLTYLTIVKLDKSIALSEA